MCSSDLPKTPKPLLTQGVRNVIQICNTSVFTTTCMFTEINIESVIHVLIAPQAQRVQSLNEDHVSGHLKGCVKDVELRAVNLLPFDWDLYLGDPLCPAEK